ncbi:uncharacterized protein LOC121920321 [Sceloporus undulatus]|uniref:uncharacterized protein LOC121920321 n=1 Tax=Sceloporus undulatus TaxID=8520 RepID=UPI001C4BB274|nr:uncharacterized protein LOC121920321 [Sceloporus undulatus]
MVTRVQETSIGSIVEILKRAREIAHGNPGVPEELQQCLEKALDATRGLQCSSTTLTSSNRIAGVNVQQGTRGEGLCFQQVDLHDFSSLIRRTSYVDCHQSVLCSETKSKTKEEKLSSDAEGRLYRMLVRMMGAKRILAIGMLNFPSLLSVAEVVPDGGNITLCATQPYLEEAVQKASDFSSHGNKIREKIGPIIDSMKELAAMGKDFDIVFIDADQRSPAEYYRFVMENHLLRMDGMLCVRDALMKGHGYLENTADENVLDVKTLNQVINSDLRTEQGVVKDEVFWGYRGRRILDRLQLDGKIAYVTGGGQGIGRAFCHALGEAGAKVAVVDLIPAKADAVACELNLKGIKSMAVAADISKPEDIQKMFDKIVARWGTVHIACNNAGINMNSSSEDTSLEEWDKTFNVNLRGLFLCCQAAGRIMLNQGYGKIINTASMASLIVPHPQKQLAYNASKAGVVKLTQTLGTEWINRGVRVNCISPGIVDTPLIHSEELKPLVQRWLTDIPAGRLAQVTDLQAAVVYLASEASDYMTGHNLVIEGGQSLW